MWDRIAPSFKKTTRYVISLLTIVFGMLGLTSLALSLFLKLIAT